MKKSILRAMPVFLFLGAFLLFTGQTKQVDQRYVGANYVHLDSTDSGTIYHMFGQGENGFSRFDTSAFLGEKTIANDGGLSYICRLDSLGAGEVDSLVWRIDTMTWDGRILETFYVNMSNTGADAVSTTSVTNTIVPDNRATVTTEVYWIDLTSQYTQCFGTKHTISQTHNKDATHGAHRPYIYPVVVK